MVENAVVKCKPLQSIKYSANLDITHNHVAPSSGLCSTQCIICHNLINVTEISSRKMSSNKKAYMFIGILNVAIILQW